MKKVSAPYPHDSRNLNAVYLAVARRTPGAKEWVAAYRDIDRGRRVVFAFFSDNASGRVWLKDETGVRGTTVRV